MHSICKLNDHCVETGINYNNAPLEGVLGSSSSSGARVWVTLDVKAFISGNGTYCHQPFQPRVRE
jgi:hypothetical protein